MMGYRFAYIVYRLESQMRLRVITPAKLNSCRQRRIALIFIGIIISYDIS